MKLSVTGLEDTSIHYYLPQSNDPKEYLYQLTSVGCFDCKPSYAVRRHNFNSYLLIVMLSGTLSYESLNRRGTVRTGYALLLDCHYPHSYKANGKCSFLFMHFDGAHSKAISSAIESTMGNVLHLKNPEQVCENISEIINQLTNGHPVDPLNVSQQVYSILLQLLAADPAQNEGRTGDPVIDQALEYIHLHLSEKITVRDIAECIGYSESYFAHKFMEATGTTPYHFVLASRIERAQQLLQTAALSIQEIAAETGFNSVANFSYAFRKEVGCSPSDYRERPV